MLKIKKGSKKELKEGGITLIALVVTLVVLLILAAISINFLVGDNGIFKTAREVEEQQKIAEWQEKLELAKLPVYAKNEGKFNLDDYLEQIVQDGITSEEDIVKNDDGSYEITTDDGYIFEIIPVPDSKNPTDVEIGYVGTEDGPRIRNIKVTDRTTNSISVEVEVANAEGATYKYEYRKEGEDDNSWKLAEESKNNTCNIIGLAGNQIYDIKVTVTTKEGSTNKITSDRTGELEVGTIEFEEYVWQGDGTASIAIRNNSLDPSYHLEYRIGVDGEWTEIASGQEITGLMHGQTIYGRLYDGVNEASPANVEILDKGKPIISIEAPSGSITTNSITVNVLSTQDNESGMPSSPSYTYYIKKTVEGDTAYVAKQTNSTNTTFTFTSLIQGTSYDVKVETKDHAGNVGSDTVTNITTKTMPGGDTGLEQGAISFGSQSWDANSHTASVTVDTNTSYKIEYQVNATAENGWKEIAKGGTISNLTHGQTVYARLYDGTNYGNEASVEIVDGTKPTAPTINITSGTPGNNNYYKSNVTVTITAGSDNESGADKIRYSVSGAQTIGETTTASGTTTANITISTDGPSTITAYTIDKAGNVSAAKTQVVYKDNTAPSTASLAVASFDETSITVQASGADSTSGVYSYEFQRSTTSATSGFTTVETKTSTANSYNYTYEDLTDGTTYYLRVIVTDRAGNTKTGIAIRQDTESSNTVEKILKEGDYVYYYDKNNTRRECVVLYDARSEYGVQIITMKAVEDVELGNGTGDSSSTTDFNTAMNSYNNAISTLNERAEAYLDTKEYASDARCVGSVPNNKEAQSGYFTSSYSYMEDYNGQLRDEDDNYLTDYDKMEDLGIINIKENYWLASRRVDPSSTYSPFYVRDVHTSIGANTLFTFYNSGSVRSFSHSRGLRPIFTLNSGIKVTGGTGEKGDPYTLGT